MNDQIKPAPLQGKVILEPALAAQEERPPAPAQRLEEASFERLEALDELTEVEPALTPRLRRRHRLLAWGLGAVGLLSLGQFGTFLVDQFASSPFWGGAWLLASCLVAVGTAGVAGREWLRLRTLKKRQDVRSRAEDLLAHQGVGQGQAFCEQLAERSGDKGREGYRTWLAQLDESHSDREVLTLYSQLVLTERDRLAQARVAKWSGEAAVLVALLTGRQLILYVTQIAASATETYTYRLRATLPVQASDGGAVAHLYYEPSVKAASAARVIAVAE